MKHLHHAAEHYSIGVYFEANGHGTVLFSSTAIGRFNDHKPSTPAQATALNHLINLMNLINQTVGDALSDMLLVEVVLAHKSYSGVEWDALYADLPNRLVKVVVKDRGVFKTEDAERRLTSPPGLQAKLDELIRKYDGGRAFVRPSGTEDVVRVYAEATLRPQADGEWFPHRNTGLSHLSLWFYRTRFQGCRNYLRLHWWRSNDSSEGVSLNTRGRLKFEC